jgi:hypothetical protein
MMAIVRAHICLLNCAMPSSNWSAAFSRCRAPIGNVTRAVDILVYDFDGLCLQTEAKDASQRIPTEVRQRQL